MSRARTKAKYLFFSCITGHPLITNQTPYSQTSNYMGASLESTQSTVTSGGNVPQGEAPQDCRLIWSGSEAGRALAPPPGLSGLW